MKTKFNRVQLGPFHPDGRLTGLIGRAELSGSDVIFTIEKPIPEFAKNHKLVKDGKINLGQPAARNLIYRTVLGGFCDASPTWEHNGVGEGTDPAFVERILRDIEDPCTEVAKYRTALSLYWKEVSQAAYKHGYYSAEASRFVHPRNQGFSVTEEEAKILEIPFHIAWGWYQETGGQMDPNWSYEISPDVR